MKGISDVRLEVEKLHEDLLKFILQRKDVINQLWTLKQSQSLDLLDMAREEFLIHQFDQHPELRQDAALKEFYQNVVKTIISQNKAYLKNIATK